LPIPFELKLALSKWKKGEPLSSDEDTRLRGYLRAKDEHSERKRIMVLGLAPEIVRLEFEEGLRDGAIGKRLRPPRSQVTIYQWRKRYPDIFRGAYQAWAAHRQYQAELTAKQQETENLLAASELGPLMRAKLRLLLETCEGKTALEVIKYIDSKIARDSRKGNVSLTMNFSPDTVNYLQSVLPGRELEGEVLGLEPDKQREEANEESVVESAED
jgi:hypothetical protein